MYAIRSYYVTHGYKVEFTNTLVATDKPPETEYHYNAAADPEGNPIGEGKSVEWVKSRDGQTWEVYKQYVNNAGDVMKSEFFSKDTYGPHPDPRTADREG